MAALASRDPHLAAMRPSRKPVDGDYAIDDRSLAQRHAPDGSWCRRSIGVHLERCLVPRAGFTASCRLHGERGMAGSIKKGRCLHGTD